LCGPERREPIPPEIFRQIRVHTNHIIYSGIYSEAPS
jgi:hypothetical protein